MNNEWQETKKEFEINAKGEYTATHVTMERQKEKVFGFEKKDFWDQLIKSVGIVAIVVPLILFKCSRDADIDKQKNMLQLELFSNVLSDVQRIILLNDTTAEFKNSKNKIDIDYYSRMMMLGNDSIVFLYKALKDTINMYSLVADANHILDTVRKHVNVIAAAYKLHNITTKFKDSTIKRRNILLASTANQWVIRYQFLKSIAEKDSASNFAWLDSTMFFFNITQPYIQREISTMPLSDSSFKIISSLAKNFSEKIGTPRAQSDKTEKDLKEKISFYFLKLNQQMKNMNKILSTE